MGILIKSSSLAAILRKSKRQPTRVLRLLMEELSVPAQFVAKRDPSQLLMVKLWMPYYVSFKIVMHTISVL